MKIVKRLLLTLVVLLMLVIAAAFILPIVYKDRIVDQVKAEINNNVNAKVDFTDVNLTLFRHFPDLGFSLEDFSVEGINEFEGIILASGEVLELELDLASLLGGGALKVESITLSKPKVNVLVLEDGKANYDIAKSSGVSSTEKTGGESNFQMQLDAYTIEAGNISYEDRSLGILVEALGLNHRGSGNLTLDVYDLNTRTEIPSLSIQYGDIAYLNNANIELDAIFNIDQKNSKYTLKENTLKANTLLLNFDGFVQMLKEDILLDFTFNTPQNEFKNLLSMVPNAYMEGFENVKADGQFTLNGSIKGAYREEPLSYPAFQVKLGVENGQVKYPDLPLGIADIFTKVNINSPSSDFDDMIIDASDFRMKVGSNPIRAKFKLTTPLSDPAVDADVEGVLDLKELTQAFPMDEEIESLSGIITADFTINTRMSVVESGDYERVNMSGDVKAQNLIYDSKTYPTVDIQSAVASFTPKQVKIDRMTAKLGRSDVEAEGSIDNILAYFSPKKTMTGDMRLRSNYFYADEWIPESSTEEAASTEEAFGASTTEYEIFDRFQFDLDAQIKELDYDVYKLINTYARGTLAPNRLDVDEGGTLIGESDMAVDGSITNMFDYLFEEGTLGGKINLVSNRFNLNEFMPESSDPAPEGGEIPGTDSALEPILVPANIAMLINADIKEVIYTNMTIDKLEGKLIVEESQVIIEDATANTLGGRMAFSGGYDTQDPENPGFQIKYDLSSMDFQKSFQTFNTFQRLAPIAEFIDGTFNSSLIMDGKLGQNMMPDLTSLNVQGFLETVNGIVKGFKPLQAVGNALKINELRNEIEMIKTKNWFEVKNGMLEVKPFDFNFKDIKMQISGQHSIALVGSMDYKIDAEIPREMLEKSAVGSAATSGLDLLSQEASKLGINLAQSETVNVALNLTGSATDPKVGFKLMGADGETTLAEAAEAKAQEEIDKAKQQLEEEATEKIEEGKAVVQETAEKAIDSVKTVADQKIAEAKDTIGKKAGELLKDKVGSAIDSTAKKELDKIFGTKKDTTAVDDIKDKLEKFNKRPFKKKKKKSGGGT